MGNICKWCGEEIEDGDVHGKLEFVDGEVRVICSMSAISAFPYQTFELNGVKDE